MTQMRGRITRTTGFWCPCCTGELPLTRADEKRLAQKEIDMDLDHEDDDITVDKPGPHRPKNASNQSGGTW